MWCANQICDWLAKDAAATVCVSAYSRGKLDNRHKQLKELLMYLGRLTLVANGLVISDGTKVRDSTAGSVP